VWSDVTNTNAPRISLPSWCADPGLLTLAPSTAPVASICRSTAPDPRAPPAPEITDAATCPTMAHPASLSRILSALQVTW
jgi:hypothetical protein